MIAPVNGPGEGVDPGQAREYESIQNRMFLLQMVLTIALVALYLFTGASAQLAAGLQARFGSLWYVANAVYLAVTLFGFAVAMYPLSLYVDHVVEHRYGLSRQDFTDWNFDYLKATALEVGLGVLFFSGLYVLLRFAPDTWWIGGTVFYVLFSIVLTTLAPLVIIPMFHDLEPLEDAALADRITEFMQAAGVEVIGVYRWGLGETTSAANAAMTGLGRSRRIILADTLLDQYSAEEILAVLAHEVGHYRHRDITRMLVASSALAGAGFWLADLVLKALVDRWSFAGVADIASFPVFVFSLFVFSIVTMPLVNAYSRRREFAADAFAVRLQRNAEPLAAALEKLALQNLADREPPRWVEWLLHSHPSIASRVRHARAALEENLP